ncbi:MAG: peptidyl-prolyl cis-trans isomerase C [Lentimonas sp.]|jgi:peptidyl-prolyl cis-trans isomerase C
MKNKTKLTIILLLISIVIGALIASFTTYSQKKNSGTIVAEVNGQKIYQTDLESKISKMFGDANDQNFSLENLPESLVEALVRDIYLQNELDKIIKNSKIAKDKTLEKQIVDYKKTVLRQAYLESEIKNKVNDQAIKNEYSQITSELYGKKEMHIKHILVNEESEAKSIKVSLKNKPESIFGVLAKKYSIDSSNADLGGDLGYVILENLDEDFANAVSKLKKGQISGPIKTKFGWHIVTLKDVRDVQIPEFEEVKGNIEEELKQEAVEDIFKKITDDAEVKILIYFKKESADKTEDEEYSNNKESNE